MNTQTTQRIVPAVLTDLPLPSGLVHSFRPLSDLEAMFFDPTTPRGQFANVVYTCEVEARKPFRGSLKTVSVNAILGFDYQRVVNSRLTKEQEEATFIAQPRVWGHRVNVFLVYHKGSLYLTMNVLNVLQGPFYSKDGQPITKEAIAPYLSEKEEGEQGGLENKVYYRDLSMVNIHRVHAFGAVFVA